MKSVITVPIQALAERTKKDLDEAAKQSGQNSVTLAAGRPIPGAAADGAGSSSALEKNPEIQGVFVVRNKRAEFVPVTTGITGVTDIEILNGLQEGDQIVTGSYKTLRTIKPDAHVKVDNSTPKAPEEN
jgi:HlyD family secretion protein